MLKKIIKKRAYNGNKIEDNLLFVTLQTQIVGLDMNNGYEQIFLSFSSKKTPTSKVGDELRLLPACSCSQIIIV